MNLMKCSNMKSVLYKARLETLKHLVMAFSCVSKLAYEVIMFPLPQFPSTMLKRRLSDESLKDFDKAA